MKLDHIISLTSLLILGISVTIPEKTHAQLRNIGPNISIEPRRCVSQNNRDCQAERFREDMQTNQLIYFQTPEKILQHFHRERTERACLERTITSPPPPVPSNCNQLLRQIDTLQQQAPVVDLRELQQREIQKFYPNVPK
ncbi:hypothetical protein PCC8801_2409 [Rippkaea orientalis PCC 8801]|uniref:Uncharacterized protein n=1 Tax=Rippkaea orientalis (strain PCC 8801 / RF-1) TaxID=41431 RepID=B7K2M7_RIPO1|nr:hypothetical protein [Rippkaea orientalis]ACK66420.1 hypothetical protein PCC8801_2409 [Rippkaea orientalis PCC 8801]